MRRGIFVTGTDTDIGKTFVACGISRYLQSKGVNVGVYKPAASGCRRVGDQVIADDGEQLWNAAGQPQSPEIVCPQRFLAPLAPHLAARQEGRELSFQEMIGGLNAWEDSDFVVVEGAGGLMSPISDDQYVADLAVEIGFPLLVVAANRIGTINQTLLTLIAAQSYDNKLAVAGVVLNSVDNSSGDPSRASNLSELKKHCQCPVLAEIPFNADQASFSFASDFFPR